MQATRDRLMPQVVQQTLPELKNALAHYIKSTNRRVSFEYLLIKGVNDSPRDLDRKSVV